MTETMPNGTVLAPGELASPLLDEVERMTTINRMRQESGNSCVGNFDFTKEDDELANLLMDCTEPINMWDQADQTLQVIHIRVREASIYDRQSHEMQDRLRTEILTVDGQVWSTNGQVASRMALSLLSGRLGQGRFDPPISISFKKVATGNGGRCVVLFINVEDLIRIHKNRIS